MDLLYYINTELARNICITIIVMKKKATNGPGRPELKPKERRSVLIQFRVTEPDALVIRKLAKKANLSVSDWLREKAIGNE